MRFKIAPVSAAQELLDVAFRAGRLQQPRLPKKMRSKERYAKEIEKNRIEVSSEELSERLVKIAESFPSLDDLPAFYRELVDVSVGVDSTKKKLGHVRSTSKLVQKLRREHIGKIFKSRSVGEIRKFSQAFYGRTSSLIKKLNADLRALDDARHQFNAFPNIQTDLFTVVLAGFPNVGKTSLLAAVTGSKPQIAPYPFTTKGLQLGYLKFKYWQIQLIDTPGLLDRPARKQNPIEKKAVAALKHLADVVVFVMDPTWGSGFSLEQQMQLLAQVKSGFGTSNVWVVINKTDLATPEEQQTAQSAVGAAFLVNHADATALQEALLQKAKETIPGSKRGL